MLLRISSLQLLKIVPENSAAVLLLEVHHQIQESLLEVALARRKKIGYKLHLTIHLS